MEYFITVVGLFIYSSDSMFYISWDSVSHFETEHYHNKVSAIVFTTKEGAIREWKTKDQEFYVKLFNSLKTTVMTELMFNEKQAEVELNCGK